jgi:hypothetical protein
MDRKEIKTTTDHILNKLQAPRTVLQLIISGRPISMEFIKASEISLDQAVQLVKTLI